MTILIKKRQLESNTELHLLETTNHYIVSVFDLDEEEYYPFSKIYNKSDKEALNKAEKRFNKGE